MLSRGAHSNRYSVMTQNYYDSNKSENICVSSYSNNGVVVILRLNNYLYDVTAHELVTGRGNPITMVNTVVLTLNA